MISPLNLSTKELISLSPADRMRNIFITGMPGTGVSTYLTELILQDVQNKQPSIVLDPYGDLSKKIIKSTSENSELIEHIDVFNTDNTNGINIFQATDQYEKNEVVSTIMNILYDLYDPGRTGIIGPRLEHAVRNAVLTIFYDESPTFDSLIKCLSDTDYVKSLLPKIKEKYLKDYWTTQIEKTSDFHKSEILDYILSKFSPFVSDARIRNIVNQKQNFSFEKMSHQGGIVLFNLGKYYYDRDITNVISTLILHSLQKFLRSTEHATIALYINEVSHWNTQAIQELFMYSRRLGLSVTATSSRLWYIPEVVRYELMRSGTVVSFNTCKTDSKYLLDAFNAETVEQITQLQPYHAALSTIKEGHPLSTSIINFTK